MRAPTRQKKHLHRGSLNSASQEERNKHLEIKSVKWKGHKIRFFEKEPGEWWALLNDIAKALQQSPWQVCQNLTNGDVLTEPLDSEDDNHVVSEAGIFKLMFASGNAKAEDFIEWMCGNLCTLRMDLALEGFQVLSMFDPKWNGARNFDNFVRGLVDGRNKALQAELNKAMRIASEAVLAMYGYSEPFDEDDLTLEMCVKREPIYAETVNLMEANKNFNLNLPVKELIHGKYAPPRT